MSDKYDWIDNVLFVAAVAGTGLLLLAGLAGVAFLVAIVVTA